MLADAKIRFWIKSKHEVGKKLGKLGMITMAVKWKMSSIGQTFDRNQANSKKRR